MNEAQPPLYALPQGHQLQEYELVRVLGFGGFGMTYLGFDHNLDKAVAIKEYLPSDIATRTGDNSVVPQASQFQDNFEWGLDRFLDEARALARFDHRHIIKVHRFFETHGTAYIVMEYAEGETLSAFLVRKGTLKESELKAILYPLLDGLEVVHRADFLHRDIKPGNIIIRDEDNSPVLLDFGSARQAIGARSRSVTSIITPGYAPIEQYSSRGDQGSWTDIYALGGVCYSALTGEVPEDATDRVRNDPLIPVSERCVGQVSAGFLSAIDWALRVDEGDRPQSIAEWRVALREETESSVNISPTRTPTTPPPDVQDQERDDASPVHHPTKSKGKLFVAFACVIALWAGAVYYYHYEYRPDQRRQAQESADAARERAERVSALLSGAAKDMAVDRLTSPAGANAWEKYQAVLELAPDHLGATAGLGSIIRRYVSKFESALSRKDFDKAGEYVSRIRMVHADAPGLSNLEKRLSAARQVERRQEQAALEKQRQEQARLATEQAEKQRQEQAAENARLVVEQAEKQRQERVFVAEVGRKPQPQGRHKGETDLHNAAKLNLPMLTIFLLKASADVHAKDNNGNTPLHWAAYKDAFATAEVLLKSGADIYAKNNEGRTPLHSAVLQDASATVGVLLKSGYDIQAKDNEGRTPLHWAAWKDASETAEILLKVGADVHAEDNTGRTPLHWAAYDDAFATVGVLLKAGADVHAITYKGSTPLRIATANNASETAKLLRRYGAYR